jgi:type III protein arginine methyltransferase
VEFDKCAFSNSHDMQISSLRPNIDFTALSNPTPVLTFDLTTASLPLNRIETIDVEATADGRCSAVFFWWDLNMDPENKVVLSCGPHWAGNPEWRDHWMQSVFYLPQTVEIKKESKVRLSCCHDEFNFWFYSEVYFFLSFFHNLYFLLIF